MFVFGFQVIYWSLIVLTITVSTTVVVITRKERIVVAPGLIEREFQFFTAIEGLFTDRISNS